MSLMHSLRSLRRAPVFAIAAALTLTLGIGSVAAAFAIAYGVLLDPLPFGQPDRLVSVGLEQRSAGLRRIQQPPAVYLTWKRFAREIAEIGFYRTGNANLSASEGIAYPRRVAATWVTASTIPLLQVTPILGRSITEEEDRDGGPQAAVISESLWREYFRSSPDVIGKTLVVNSVPRTVVGVMPQEFIFPAAETKLWLPARLDRDASSMMGFAYSGVARLAGGATPADAQRELASLLPRLATLFPRAESGATTASWLEQARPAPVVVPLRDEITHGIARTLWMLVAAAGLVLVVALANVANLMLIRADARQLELAIREALGASRWRIATHLLGESLILSSVAGAVALAAAWGAVRLVVAFGPAGVPRLSELHVGATTIGVVVATSLLAAIVCTLLPTIRIRSAPLSINLRDGGRGETAGRVRQRMRSTIAAFQIAVALVALAGSALLLRSFERLSQEQPGFEVANVMTVWTQLPFARYGDSASVAFYARLTESVARLPGVTAVGVTSRLPLGDGERRQLSFRRDDGRTLPVSIVAADAGYFTTMRIPVLAGPNFQPLGVQRDGEIVLSRRAVETFFASVTPSGAIGRRILLAPAGPTYTVVGVVGDVRDQGLGTPPSPTIYMPQSVPIDRRTEPAARRTMALVVRSALPASGIITAIRQVVHDLDATIPLFNVESMDDVVRASTARLSMTLAMMVAAAIVTLLLGAIGLYGVMSYMVALRTRELGIRIALGADPVQLARSVALRGLTLVASGACAGIALYAIATPFLRGYVYGVTAADPVTLAGAVVVLVATACVAGWIPARRAARVDPTEALRAE